ncbi:cell division cycle protein 16 [Brevipalpus obovatus]|uniref:cell division cycle protein 16 n=1 Tax=Brevipalpus obovatus TaxID=246614 RepID=UPI003D9FAEE5
MANDALLNRLRSLVVEMMDMSEYKTASFWCNKILSLPNSDKNDVYKQAKCFFLLREYHRAAHCIKSRNLHLTDLASRHLAAKCHFIAKEFKEAYEILECNELDATGKRMDFELESSEEDRSLESAIYMLKGHIFEAMDNRGEAVIWYRKALERDVYCFEALDCLIQHQMLSQEEEENLMETLRNDNQGTKEENQLIFYLYQSHLKKYAKPDDSPAPEGFNSILSENVDILTSAAERHYYNCDFHKCMELTERVLKIDIYHTRCLPIHISCLMELKKTNTLFDLAHRLVDLYPESAVSWYAVGCYYLMINKMDAARRFLSKATTLDNVFGPAWLLYGHSFAIESEHDQAMAAYFKAFHLMKGCHLPLLYIGLEYGLTENTKFSEQFFQQALAIAPNDPFVLHELGVISYQMKDYHAAHQHFSNALDLIKNKRDVSCLPEKWEPVLNNMAFVLRRLKKYDEALDYHKQALVLCSLNPSTYSAIGYIHILTGKYKEAVDYFHKALGLKRDDLCAQSLLAIALEQMWKENSPLFNELPPYEDESFMEKNYLRNNLLDESPHEDRLLDDKDLEKSSSENDTENNASGLDVEMDLSP